MPVKPAKTIQIKSLSPASKPEQVRPAAPCSSQAAPKPQQASPAPKAQNQPVQISGINTSDPMVMAIIAAIIWSLAYLVMGNTRKALIYTGAIIGLGIVLFILTFFAWCLFPLLIVFPAIWVAILYDVYQISSGNKAILPDF